MADVLDIAKYIITLADEEAGDLISNLKLQKLAYYSQGFSLALSGNSLFDAEIKAWEHGPVVPILYDEYKKFASDAISNEAPFDDSVLSDANKELINEVYEVYGQFSAWKLRNMTHDEAPWKNTLQNSEINHTELTKYFSTQIN